ncbi:MAG: thiamine pyrophosphate-binding protein [Hyphomicrobiaceae bacterium]
MSEENRNTMTGTEALVTLLSQHGVDTIFGLCGDTSLPLYDTLHRDARGISHYLTRDERHAGYMADGYARVTGKPGVCEGPSGGGATYILPGVVEANESSIPVLAITTDVAVTSQGKFPLTELRQDELFRPLTKYNGVIDTADRLPNMVRAAFRAMTTGTPGAAHLGLPFDVQKQHLDGSNVWAQSDFSSFPAWPLAPAARSVEAATEAIVKARNPVIICGGGVVIAGAEGELARLAERLDLVVATTVSGQGSLADTHPNCLGVVGSNGGVIATRSIVEEADLVIFVGCRAGSVTTERWRFPAAGTPIVHIDSNPMAISASYETAFPVLGDAQLALAAVNEALDTLKPSTTFGGAARVATAKQAKFAAFEALATSNDTPIKPERVVADLNAALPADAVVVCDPGTPCPYFSAFYQTSLPGRHFISNRAHGALGFSMAAAMGAQIGRPNAKVISVMGDGSFAFSVGEFETITRYNLPILFIVFSNSVFGWIKAGQKSGFGERYFSVDFNRTDHAAVAQAYGVKSWRVEDPRALRGVLDEAARHDGPALVDIISQPLQDSQAPVSEWIA